MDHKQQHHEHHRHDREEHKKEQKQHEHQQEKKEKEGGWPVHPLWLVVLGVILTLGAVMVWIFAIP